MEPGHCLKGWFPKTIERKHWHFILTPPDANGEVVVVNVESPRGTKTQLLRKADYTDLEYDSAVVWSAASVQKVELIQKAMKHNLFEVRPRLDINKVKEMIAEGAHRGLIPPEIQARLRAGGMCP